MLLGERLGLDGRNVIGKRDRGGAEVAAMLHVAAAPLPAKVGQLVLVVVHRRRAFVDHQLIGLQLPQERVHQHEGEPHLLGDVAAGGVAPGQQELEDQGLDLALGQPRGAERLRLDGQEGILVVVRLGLGRLMRGGLGRGLLRSRLARDPVDPLQQGIELRVFGGRGVVVGLRGGQRGPGIGVPPRPAVTGQAGQQIVFGRGAHGSTGGPPFLRQAALIRGPQQI